jgi:hypothetical protein
LLLSLNIRFLLATTYHLLSSTFFIPETIDFTILRSIVDFDQYFSVSL